MHPELGLVNCFRIIDDYGQGYFDINDLRIFLRHYLPSLSQQKLERIFRRMDLDYDGRVTYEEWNQVARPRDIEDTIILDAEKNADFIADQKTRKRYEKAISPEKFKKTIYDEEAMHSSRISISPTKEYIRIPVVTATQTISNIAPKSDYSHLPVNTQTSQLADANHRASFLDADPNINANSLIMTQSPAKDGYTEFSYNQNGLRVKVKLSPSKEAKYGEENTNIPKITLKHSGNSGDLK